MSVRTFITTVFLYVHSTNEIENHTSNCKYLNMVRLNNMYSKNMLKNGLDCMTGSVTLLSDCMTGSVTLLSDCKYLINFLT
jgi:hypothetical protein